MRKGLLFIVLFAVLTVFEASAQTKSANTKTDKKNKNIFWPQNSREFALFSYSFIEEKSWQEAEYYISEAISRDSTNSFYYDLRGVVRVNNRNYQGALLDFGKALKLDSGDYDAYSGRAKAYYALKEYDKALADLKKAIDLGVETSEVYDLKARIEVMQGNCIDAQTDMKKAEALKDN